ncbi:T9SS type A sorting domain-containing protein [candidate division KSB1 bacterium]|nr:T9SS type A sorting domain-containing protein [candidate division KSB1 bacterium]
MRNRYIVPAIVLSLILVVSIGIAQNLYDNPESVVYDAVRNRYLVSNTGSGRIVAVDSNGTQSSFNNDQSSIRGLHIMGDTLYAAANAGVVAFDLAGGTKLFTIAITGRAFLNDITSNGEDLLYVTDTGGGVIYKVHPADQWYDTVANGLSSPNGIYYDEANHRLVVCYWRANSPISTVNPLSGTVTTLVNTTYSNLDGLTMDKEGRFYVSSAGSGSVYRYDNAFADPAELFSTGHAAPADIYFDPVNDVLAVPNFNANSVDFIPVEPPAIPQTIVTNTNDSGPGSLREAMTVAMSDTDSDTIVFDIPASDPNYDETTGVWTIRPATTLPEIDQGLLVIDGHTQTQNRGDTNPDGPEIELDGSNGGNIHAFDITSKKNRIRGLIINRFYLAFNISGKNATGNFIEDNYIGTSADGSSARSNLTGIHVRYGASGNRLGLAQRGNVISGNSYAGIIIGPDAHRNMIQGNYIGVDKRGKTALGNMFNGIMVIGNSSENQIGGSLNGEGNIIAGSKSHNNLFLGNGVLIQDSERNAVEGNYIGTDAVTGRAVANVLHGVAILGGGHNTIGGASDPSGNVISGNSKHGILIGQSTANIVKNNKIGTGTQGQAEIGNLSSGICINDGSRNNVIGPGNLICHNAEHGVLVEHDSTLNNQITENSIYDNGGKGIATIDGGNRQLNPPVFTEITTNHVRGQTYPSSAVEIFSDDEDEGQSFLGRTTSRPSGEFYLSEPVTGHNVSATVTDDHGNTSEFGSSLNTVVNQEDPVLPQQFCLDQNYPNPFNQGTTIAYQLARDGHVRLTILNIKGQKVIAFDSNEKKGRHRIQWDGRNHDGKTMPSGLYLYRLETEGRRVVKKLILTR